MDDQETFEHGSGLSDMTKGMGSSGERGKGSGEERGKGSSGERQQPSRMPERGRSQAEDR